MPVPLADLIDDLDRLLTPERFEDYGPNGLQFPGREQVTTVVTGVSASVELFDRAASEDADLVLVHHGLFWGAGPGPVDEALKRRLRPLFERDMSLVAYHLPLDAHPEVGNNAQLLATIGAQDTGPFGEHRGSAIGRRGRFANDGVSAAELVARVQRATDRAPLHFDAGPEPVRDVAVVSGAGAGHLPEAVMAGVDAFITGEPAERVMAEARESAIHFLAAGHYATETFGVRRLGERLAERFGVRHVFVDLPNPI
jgi:dinuclear metal center YbgI/SA1388 family protein